MREKSLPVRVLHDEFGEFVDDLLVPPEPQFRAQPLLQDRQPRFLQSPAQLFDPRCRHVGQWGSSPQVESTPQQRCLELRVVRLSTSRGDEGAEAVGVHGHRVGPQDVGGPPSGDPYVIMMCPGHLPIWCAVGRRGHGSHGERCAGGDSGHVRSTRRSTETSRFTCSASTAKTSRCWRGPRSSCRSPAHASTSPKSRNSTAPPRCARQSARPPPRRAGSQITPSIPVPNRLIDDSSCSPYSTGPARKFGERRECEIQAPKRRLTE